MCAHTCTHMLHTKFIKKLMGPGFLPFAMWVLGIKLELWDLVAGTFRYGAIWPEPFLSVIMIRIRVEHQVNPITLIPMTGCGKSVGYNCTLKFHLSCEECSSDRFPVTLVTKRGKHLVGLRAPNDSIKEVRVVVRVSGSWSTWLGFISPASHSSVAQSWFSCVAPQFSGCPMCGGVSGLLIAPGFLGELKVTISKTVRTGSGTQ